MSQTKKNSDFIDEFNDSQDPETETSGGGSDEFARMLGESFKGSTKKFKVGDRVRGKILVVGREEVYVSTGTPTDGAVARRDLLDAEGNFPYKVDDVIDLFVTQVRGGEIRLSKNPTDRNLAEDLEDAFDKMLPIPGRVVEVCKGGVRVNIKGKLAFCPISQLDSKHVEGDGAEYVGRSFDFRITQFSEGGRNIVVSRKKLLVEERELGTASFLEETKDGAIVTGKVVRLEPFGAFVELAPGVDGLVHISEIAWSRIGAPSDVLAPGQEVAVKLLKREILNGRAKISLSIKQATERPAAPERSSAAGAANPAKDDPTSKFAVGQLFTGKVTRKEVYGFFLEIEPGVTGLLHKSRTFDHSDFRLEKVKVGDSLAVQIAEIKLPERQISLSLPRDAGEDDWKQHQQAQATSGATSFGTLGDRMKAALAAKKK
ncbi:MAG: S1 RNA-binding domain-containing protein [Bdellovibrionales bacterium]|nr:S1 RNA-binding domain-containing protein [Bdellovibrionales bacterium]